MRARSRWMTRVLICLALGCFVSPAHAGSSGGESAEVPVLSEEGDQALEEAEEAISEKEDAEGSAEIEEAVPEADQAGEQAEWTVMLYLCGTDLESDGSMATLNLEMISRTLPNERVNVLIETGGTKKWHAQEKIGIDIANDRLQRWTYGKEGFSLVDEQENASMAKYTTLADFIRWGSENYPAEKNMLLLWDHGGGSASGLILDELYDCAIMSLDGLERALSDGGTHFDVLMTDTCLMASLETCQAVASHADYLVASEEILPGEGSNYEEWLQTLYDEPECDAVRLGKNVCNATQVMYAEHEDAASLNGLTFSVIDLSRLDPVTEAFENYMKEVVGLLDSPEAFGIYVNAVSQTERYMIRSMWDLYDLARRAMKGGISKETALSLENAVDDAVVYNVRGSYHPYSHGLSAYLRYNGDRGELDRLARNDRNPWQLAFLDAVCLKWDAPAWVTDIVGEIPQLEPEYYVANFEVEVPEDQGIPILHIYSGVSTGGTICYELQRYDEEKQSWFILGQSSDVRWLSIDEEEMTFAADFAGKWPAIGDRFLSVTSKDEADHTVLMEALVNIPSWSNREMNLRIAADYPANPPVQGLEEETDSTEKDAADDPAEEDWEDGEVKYEIVGLWDEYDSSTGLINRNTWSLAEIAGIDMEICEPVYSNYLKSVGDMAYMEPIAIGFDLEVEDTVLPAGTYRMRYSISDMLDKTYTSDFYELTWDGEQAVFEIPPEKETQE